MYENCIMQFQMYAKVLSILSKGYLPIPILPSSNLQESLGNVKKAIQTTNTDYDIDIKRQHLYY